MTWQVNQLLKATSFCYHFHYFKPSHHFICLSFDRSHPVLLHNNTVIYMTTSVAKFTTFTGYIDVPMLLSLPFLTRL